MRVSQWFLGASLLLGLALVSACSKDAPAESATPEGNALPLVVDVEGQKQEVLDWRAERVERLQRPDGWLSLVALNWLEYGNSFVGSGATKGVRLPVGPEEVGLVTLERDNTVRFKPTPGAGVLIDGKAVNGTVVLRSDVDEGGPSVVSFNKGDASFVLIKRADRFGLRVRDALAPTRTGFSGIDYFDIDTSFRFNARFEAHPAGQKLGIVNVLGMEEPMDNPGVVVFERDGVEYRLEAVDEGDGRLFLIFADRTSGHETYAAARFLYAEPADAEGTTVVDFNRAYNPPCAFTAFSTCPLPPASNRLDLRIEAGEKKPRKSGTSA